MGVCEGHIPKGLRCLNVRVSIDCTVCTCGSSCVNSGIFAKQMLFYFLLFFKKLLKSQSNYYKYTHDILSNIKRNKNNKKSLQQKTNEKLEKKRASEIENLWIRFYLPLFLKGLNCAEFYNFNFEVKKNNLRPKFIIWFLVNRKKSHSSFLSLH